MKLKNPYGKVAIEISSVKAEGEILVIKGEALGSMPITVHVTAEDIWESRRFLTWSVWRRLPVLFVRGAWRTHRHPAGHSQVGKPA
jgi:hypothetical protein